MTLDARGEEPKVWDLLVSYFPALPYNKKLPISIVTFFICSIPLNEIHRAQL